MEPLEVHETGPQVAGHIPMGRAVFTDNPKEGQEAVKDNENGQKEEIILVSYLLKKIQRVPINVFLMLFQRPIN